MAFSYELEYLSFLMQLGLIGFSLIIIPIILHFISLINWKVNNKKVLFFIIVDFMIWLLKPIFNPSFLAVTSSSVIVVIIIFSYYFKEKKEF